MEWKAYVSDCLVSAGQDGREYRCKKSEGGWSADVINPAVDVPFSPAPTILETGLSLEAALNACKTYEEEQIKKGQQMAEKTIQDQDTTPERI